MILVTGALGYIASKCVLSLFDEDYSVIGFDNLSTGHIEIVDILKKYGDFTFVKGELQNKPEIDNVFKKYKIDTVIHFAAFSRVAQSVVEPQKYYRNNVFGSLNLLDSMVEHGVKKIVFSSTAAVYGEPKYTPIDENHPQKPINPYGKTKLAVENIMDDYDRAYGLKSVRLRYFNVAGADEKNRVGEWHEPETHLIANILKSALGADKTFELYGDDYETKDGSCIRDYIDIEDLSKAHILALKYLENGGKTNFFNLGTKEGSSVFEVFNEAKSAVGKEIPFKICPKRQGDPAILIADNKKAKEILGWEPSRNLKQSIRSAFEWEKKLSALSAD